MSMQGAAPPGEAVVGYDRQMNGAREAGERVARKQEQIATERRSAEEELRVQEARQDEARASISRIEVEQRAADEQLNAAQRRLFQAREAMQAQGQKTAEAKATHAGLVERASGLAMDIQRLEASSRELATGWSRAVRTSSARTRNGPSWQVGLSRQKGSSMLISEASRSARACAGRRRTIASTSRVVRTAGGAYPRVRRSLEGVRSEVAQLDVQRATAETDLTHLAASCVESVQAPSTKSRRGRAAGAERPVGPRRAP